MKKVYNILNCGHSRARAFLVVTRLRRMKRTSLLADKAATALYSSEISTYCIRSCDAVDPFGAAQQQWRPTA